MSKKGGTKKQVVHKPPMTNKAEEEVRPNPTARATPVRAPIRLDGLCWEFIISTKGSCGTFARQRVRVQDDRSDRQRSVSSVAKENVYEHRR